MWRCVLLQRRGKEMQARLHAQRERGAMFIITTVPTCVDQELSNDDVEINTRLALGLPPQPQMPYQCTCGQPNGSYAADPWHALSCVDELHSSVTDRHDGMKRAVARLAEAVGAKVVVEPRKHERREKKERQRRSGPAEEKQQRERKEGKGSVVENEGREKKKEDNKRPDSVVELPGKKWWTDETIWHPYGPTNVSVSAQSPQALLKTAEQQKHIKYDEEASRAGAIFVPFALESTGGFGKEALLFIRELIAESKKQHMVWRDKEFVNMAYRNIAIAVARGNTMIIKSNLAKQEPEHRHRRG